MRRSRREYTNQLPFRFRPEWMSTENLSKEMSMKANWMHKAYQLRQTFDEEAELNGINETTRQKVFEEFQGFEGTELMTDISVHPDIPVILDKSTGKVYIVLHGANAGKSDTVAGQQINAYDKGSWKRAYTLPNDQTQKRYPELDEVSKKLLTRFKPEQIETIAYSNSGPKAIYLNKKFKFKTTAFDPVIGTAQSGHIRSGLPAEAHFVRTTKVSVGMEAGKVTNPSRLLVDPVSNKAKNVKITYVPPNPELQENVNIMTNEAETNLERAAIKLEDTVLGGHDLGQWTSDTPRTTDVSLDKSATLKNTVSGLATGLAATRIAEDLGVENQAGVSAINTSLDAGVSVGASLLRGNTASVAARAGMSTAAELALPTLAAYESATTVGQLVDHATESWDDRGAAAALTGGASGFAGGASAIAAAQAQQRLASAGRAAYNAARGYQFLASTEAADALAAGESAAFVAEESTALLAESAAEAGLLAAEETALEATGVAAAAEGGLNPIADALFVGTAIVTGATLLGVGLGHLFGQHEKVHHDHPDVQAKFNEIRMKYEAYVFSQSVDLDSENKLNQNVLSPHERDFMTNIDGDFFNRYQTRLDEIVSDARTRRDNLLETEREYIQQIHDYRMSDPFFDSSRLPGGVIEYLHARHPEILEDIQVTRTENLNRINSLASELNIDNSTLIDLYRRRARNEINATDLTNEISYTFERNKDTALLIEYIGTSVVEELNKNIRRRERRAGPLDHENLAHYIDNFTRAHLRNYVRSQEDTINEQRQKRFDMSRVSADDYWQNYETDMRTDMPESMKVTDSEMNAMADELMEN